MHCSTSHVGTKAANIQPAAHVLVSHLRWCMPQNLWSCCVMGFRACNTSQVYIWRPGAPPATVRTLFQGAEDWGKEPAAKKGDKTRRRFTTHEEDFALRHTMDALLKDDPSAKVPGSPPSTLNIEPVRGRNEPARDACSSMSRPVRSDPFPGIGKPADSGRPLAVCLSSPS